MTFKRKELFNLKVTKFNELMKEIKMRNAEAYNYLTTIDCEKMDSSI